MKAEIHLSYKTNKYMTIFIQVMIIVSLLTYCLKTLPELKGYEFTFEILDLIWGGFFLVEYIVRILSAHKKLKYLFSFYGIIDFLAIVPLFISFGLIDLRAIRIFRLIRIFKLLRLIRHSKAAVRLYRAFVCVKEEFMVFGVITMMLIFLASIGIYHFENEVQPEAFKSAFHSMWWAITTITTVGYGDMSPVTVGGKVFTGFIMLIGISVISVPAGLITYALTKTNERSSKN